MAEEHHESDQESLKSLIDELLADDEFDEEEIVFAHAFLAVPISTVVRALRVGEAPPRTRCRIFGVDHKITNVHMFLAGEENWTLLWMPLRCLNIASILSLELRDVVHWISVYEAYRCRAYLRFDAGECVCEVLDTERMWRQNIWTGDELLGGGERLFPELDDFLDAISHDYPPIDKELDHDSIASSDESKIHWSQFYKRILEIQIDPRCKTFSFHGDWNAEIRASLEQSP